jgi:predicted TIM-barrel fold metal-dependent hydrolase
VSVLDQTTSATQLVPSGWAGPLIDADVHVNVPSIEHLRRYMSDHWAEFVVEAGFSGPFGVATIYPPGAPTTVRPEWVPADGRPPASDLELVREQVLDAGGAEAAILNCYYGIESVRHPDLALALAQAVNDWLIAEFLDQDERLRASLVLPGHDPRAAAAEVDRVGGHPGFVQVFLPVRSAKLWGNRVWHPLFEAITRHGLVAGVQNGGIPDGPPTPTGWPSWYVEETAGDIQTFMAQITSMVAEGLFEQFPDLQVAVLEGGFTWLGPLLWRMDKEWKGLRRDIPWVKRPPSKTVREHFKFSVQPLDLGPAEHYGAVVDWLGSDELLMFGSDYPHWHNEDVAALLAVLPEAAHARVMSENARSLYGL